MKRIFAALAALGIVLTSFSVASADAYLAPMNSVPAGYLGIHIVDQTYWGEGSSVVRATIRQGTETSDEDAIICGISGFVACDFLKLNALNMTANSIFAKCTSDTEIGCIESVSIYKKDTEAKPASFIRQVGGSTFDAIPSQNLTKGSTISLWSAQDAPNMASANTYSVLVKQTSVFNQDANKYQPVNLNIMVMPYREVSKQWSQPIVWTETRRSDGTRQLGSTGGNPDCAWVDAGLCGSIQDYAPDTRVKLTLRLSKQIGGWFKGRMQTPNISIESFNADANRVTLDGAPSSVPQFFTLLDRTNGPAELKSLVGLDRGRHPQGAGNMGGTTSTTADQDGGFLWVDKFRELAKDTAAGVSTVWSAGTIQGQGNNCLSDTSKLLGIVSTNSMVYSGSAPVFQNGQLSYKVAGMHYLPGGKEAATGTYDLVMRSDVARCLYRFSSAPIQATISVTSASGELKTATTNVSEKDGWLRMGAYDFTFSENNIKAKITQPKAAKKTTITCVKGKTTKKVTAVNPKCPAGFKKK